MGYTVDELTKEIDKIEAKNKSTKSDIEARKVKRKVESIYENKKKKKDTKRRIKLTLVSLGICIGLSNLTSSNALINITSGISKLDSLISDDTKDELYSILNINKNTDLVDNYKVLEAIEDNSNLTDSEKKLIYSFIDMLNDNKYLDKQSAYNDLKNLDIIYTEKDSSYSDTTTGVYFINKDLIEIFSDNDKQETLIHELVHCIYSNSSTKYLPDYFSEGMAELLTNEYFTTTPFVEEKSYPFEITITKTLCEMVGSDKVLEAYSTGKMSIIEKELEETMNKDDTKEFLNNLNTMFKEYSKNNTIKNNYSQVFNYMDSFFSKKYQDNTEKLEVYIYNKGIIQLLSNSDPGTAYLYYLLNNGFYIKPYFSENLKEKYSDHYFTSYSEASSLKTSGEKTLRKNYDVEING